MPKTTLLTVAIVALLLLNLGTLAVVWRQRAPMGHRGPGRRDGLRPEDRPLHDRGPARQISRLLQFDEAQERQFRTLRDRHHARTLELRREARALHRRLYLVLLDSAATIRRDSLLAAIAANERTRATLNYDHFAELRALCRPAQRTHFRALMEQVADQFVGAGAPPPRPGDELPPGGPRP